MEYFKFVSNKDDSDIAIDYIEHLEGNQVGITKPSHITIQGKVYLHKVSVLISKTDPIGFIQNDAELLKVTLHEIGHAIGWFGHSENKDSIMYPTKVNRNATITPSDIKYINRLYGF